VIGAAVDWTSVLDTAILTTPALIAALYARKANQRAAHITSQVETPSGKPLGEVAEYAHDTAIANNLLLAKANGETEPADHETIRAGGESPPLIPSPEPEP